jgi:hypothetical protein
MRAVLLFLKDDFKLYRAEYFLVGVAFSLAIFTAIIMIFIFLSKP